MYKTRHGLVSLGLWIVTRTLVPTTIWRKGLRGDFYRDRRSPIVPPISSVRRVWPGRWTYIPSKPVSSNIQTLRDLIKVFSFVFQTLTFLTRKKISLTKDIFTWKRKSDNPPISWLILWTCSSYKKMNWKYSSIKIFSETLQWPPFRLRVEKSYNGKFWVQYKLVFNVCLSINDRRRHFT